ncbi:MAG: heparinase II/III family protein [Lentisphaeria bacterium]|nr:heparinase II/III family protein [Lentisphaeria bacterium]
MAERNAKKRQKKLQIDPAPLFPPASNRAAWLEALKIPRNRKQAREIVKIAREVQKQPIPAVPASLFMEFTREGNRSHYEAGYFARRANLNALVLAEVFEYEGNFLDAIIDYLWEITAEHTWCLPAHCPKTGDPLPEPPTNIVDLFAAETGMTLAQVLNLLESELMKVSPNLIRTVRENLLRRVVDPILIEPFPFWWLHGRNNWTPWCCSNCLATALCVLKDDPDKLRKAVSVLQPGIDRYLELYPADGGCTEGPSYWGKSPGILLFWMEQLRDWSRSPKIGPMAEYIVDACLTPTCYAAFGDCPPRIALPGAAKDPAATRTGKVRAYQWWPVAPWICCRYGKRIGSENLISMGLKSAQDYPVRTLLRDLMAAQAFFFWIPARRAGAIRKKPVKFYPESQLLFLNESGVALAAKRGWECSHHHSDVGQVILFYRNEPMLIDLGNTEYRRETFSSKRWENWRINAEGHNIPQFNGIRQLAGTPPLPDSMAVTENEDGMTCRMDLTNSYPAEAGVVSCIRELIWNRREKTLEIRDSWKLKKRSGNTVRIPYYTPAKIVCRKGQWKIGKVGVRPENCSASAEKVPLEDSVQVINWGKTVNRYEVTAKSGASGSCSIFFEFK